MKSPEDEQKAYDHYKDDLHYQASMFESSFSDGFRQGKAKANKKMVLAMAKKEYSIKTIAEVTALTETEIEVVLK